MFASACLMDSIRCFEGANLSSVKRKKLSAKTRMIKVASYARTTSAISSVTWTTSASTALQCLTQIASPHQTVRFSVQRLLPKSAPMPSATRESLVPSRSVAVLDRPPMRWHATRRKIAKRVPSRMGQPATRPSSRRIESGAWSEIPPISTAQIRPIAASRLPTMGQSSLKSASHR